MATTPQRGPLWRTRERAQPVTPLELLFDLVFVYAISQLTHHLHDHLDGTGAAQTAVLLLAMSSVWFNTVWAVNLLDVSRAPIRLLVLVVMLISGVMSTSITAAFTDRAWLFAAALATFQIGSAAFMLTTRPDPAMRSHFVRTLVWAVFTSAVWLAGAAVDNSQLRLAIWAAITLVQYLLIWRGHPIFGMGSTDTADYHLAGGHIVERCRLIFLIAVGETVISALTAFTEGSVTPLRFAALGVAFVGTISIWWIYFHRGESAGKSMMEAAADTAVVARRAIYALVAMVSGLVLVAVGDELVITYPTGHNSLALSVLLCGGPAVFLAAKAWFVRPADEPKTLTRARIAAIATLAALGFLTNPLPSLLAASGAAAVLLTVALLESRFASAAESDRDATDRN